MLPFRRKVQNMYVCNVPKRTGAPKINFYFRRGKRDVKIKTLNFDRLFCVLTHDLYSANGAGVTLDVPAPHCHRIPLLQGEHFLWFVFFRFGFLHRCHRSVFHLGFCNLTFDVDHVIDDLLLLLAADRITLPT